MLKRGRMHIVVLNDKGKQIKSRGLEFFLFTDMLLYAKPHRKGSMTSYVVYKMAHRSLVEAKPIDKSSAPHIAAAFKGDECMIELLLYGPQTVRLCLRAASDTDRWVVGSRYLPSLI